MKVSDRWLREFVDLDMLALEVAEVARTLTFVGLAVEGITAEGGEAVIDLEVTSNRPDCLNHLGVARELAAQFRLKLAIPEAAEPPGEGTSAPATVTIEDPDLCPRYAARVISGIRIGESPEWLKARLRAVGQRPINNIVDITNYVLFQVGQPLHAFDFDKLEGGAIVVRCARAGEGLVTLDGVVRTPGPSMLMICDADRPLAVAGVMGGEDSEIGENTTTLLLESACFHPPSVRSTSRKLELRTEASFRFERGTDPEMPVRALNLATRLILQLAGGRCLGPALDVYPVRWKPKEIELRTEKIRDLLGLEIDPEFTGDILRRLGFEVSPSPAGSFRVGIPSHRHDVSREVDLIEEVARHYGYDKVEGRYPPAVRPGAFLPTEQQERVLTGVLAGLGFQEAINYVFTTDEKEKAIVSAGAGRPVTLLNPLTESDTQLRTSLLPGLLQSLRHNLNHGNPSVRLFETGSVYFSKSASPAPAVREEQRLGLIATGTYYEPYWQAGGEAVSFFHLKGAIEVLLARLGCQAEFQRVDSEPYLHPGVAARLQTGRQWLGFLGQLHPRLQEEFKFPQEVLVAELLLAPLLAQPGAGPRYRALSRFPSIERDFSFVIDKGIEFGSLLRCLDDLSIFELQGVQLIDFYQGRNLPSNKVSLTVRLTFVHPERTLTQDEVRKQCDRILAELHVRFDIETRA